MEALRSENCTEKTIAYNYSALMDLYDIFKPKDIPLILARTKQYLIDGHKWYQKNVRNIGFDDIEPNIEFVDELKPVAEKMLLFSGTYISFASKERSFEVNLVPFDKFLKVKPIKARLEEISFTQTKLRLFLNESNITAFKELAEFLEMLNYILQDIECEDTFKYL